MQGKNRNCKSYIDTSSVKKEIKKLSSIDKSLIPKYLDDLKQEKKVKGKEITKDNPYYKYL